MSNNTKKELVPELRFPEFENIGTWRAKKLIDVADKGIKWSFIGGPFGSNLKSSDYVSEGVRIIQLQNIGDAEFKDDYQIFTSEEKADELLSNNIYPGDIILSKMGDPVGRACLIPDTHSRYVMCSDGIRLVVDESEFSKYFIYILINSDWFRASVEASSTGSTRKRIGLDVLKKLELIVPKNIEEQQKIADCLSSLDELIAVHTQKHQELQSYKKGLLQNLFPVEDETVPKLRFPEFRGSGDWNRSKIKKHIDLLSGYAFKSQYFSENGKKLLTPKNFTKDGFANFSEENTKLTVEKCDEKYLCSEGDLLLLLTDLTASCELLGKLILLSKSDGRVLLNQRIAKVIPNKKISNRFLLYFFLTESYLNHIKNTASGSTVRHSSNKIVLDTNISAPSFSEQQKIADCLSSVDDLIGSHAKKIETLKAHKKGLMQQLFPAMEAEASTTQEVKAEECQ